ncbi:hypothetical protein FB645_003237 [Coemansia sp. IMI 203386]|nr:hypothetical protein FB645_003237 [Coemansia sp. IMI 203386]
MFLLTMPAAYFPWVKIAFSLVIENSWPVTELVAIAIGHLFWFLAEEWPTRVESGGSRPLSAPAALCRLFRQTDAREEENDDYDDDDNGNFGAVPEMLIQAEPANNLPPVYSENDNTSAQNNIESLAEQREDEVDQEVDSVVRQRQPRLLEAE